VSEWGKHLVILKADGTFMALVRLQGYPDGLAFRYNLLDKVLHRFVFV